MQVQRRGWALGWRHVEEAIGKGVWLLTVCRARAMHLRVTSGWFLRRSSRSGMPEARLGSCNSTEASTGRDHVWPTSS